MAVSRERLQSVLAPKIHQELSLSEEPLAHGVSHAKEYAWEAMARALSIQRGLVIVNLPPEEQTFAATLQGHSLTTKISQAKADHIKALTGADVLLRFFITDYGLTPMSWRNGYITFEVTTTLVFGAVVAFSKIPAAKAVAGAYLAQEAIEEAAEAYAGFWTLNVVARPVRIEAELIRLTPVATIWKTSDTGFSDIKLSRMIKSVETSVRDVQLDQATEDAVRGIVAEFVKATGTLGSKSSLQNNLDSPDSAHP